MMMIGLNPGPRVGYWGPYIGLHPWNATFLPTWLQNVLVL